MAIPLIPIMLTAIGGVIVGALTRQPEINELKEQVKNLQAEVERLQNLIRMQDRQIKTLLVRYKSLKVYQLTEKKNSRNFLRGALIFQYAYKDYLELLMKSVDCGNVNMKEEETIFYNIFDKVIEGQTVSDGEKEAIKEYIIYRYKYQIDNLIECDCNGLIERLEKYNA